MVDASSILLRLEFQGEISSSSNDSEELNSHDKYFFISGIDVGLDRWQKVYQTWEPHFNDHILSFNDAHLMMALVGKYFQIWKCCRLQANLKLTRFETT
jgi:hypothetical protein